MNELKSQKRNGILRQEARFGKMKATTMAANENLTLFNYGAEEANGLMVRNPEIVMQLIS